MPKRHGRRKKQQKVSKANLTKKGRHASPAAKVSSSQQHKRKSLSAAEFRVALESLFAKKKKSSYSCPQKTLIADGTIFELADFLSRDECACVIELAEAAGYTLAELRESKYTAHRRNGHIRVDSPVLAQQLWKRLADTGAFKKKQDGGRIACGLNPNFRLYRYERGDRFGMHVDESVSLDKSHETLFTLLVYLNGVGDTTGGASPLAGGETVFYTGTTVRNARPILRFPPRTGSALVHMHGERCLLHEGALVKSGIKYLLRTDVVYGPPC